MNLLKVTIVGNNEKDHRAFFILLGIGFVPLALLTLFPDVASKPNLLGYYGHCSFAPVSTIILFILSPVFFLLGYKLFKKP